MTQSTCRGDLKVWEGTAGSAARRLQSGREARHAAAGEAGRAPRRRLGASRAALRQTPCSGEALASGSPLFSTAPPPPAAASPALGTSRGATATCQEPPCYCSSCSSPPGRAPAKVRSSPAPGACPSGVPLAAAGSCRFLAPSPPPSAPLGGVLAYRGFPASPSLSRGA